MKKIRLTWPTVVILTAAIALAAASFYYDHRIREIPIAHTYIPYQTAITPEIQLLQDYVRIDTSNPPGREAAGAAFLMKQLSESGIVAELIESAPARTNVYARIRGRSDGGGLLLLHHIDVVPVRPQEWKRPPFRGEIAMNMMWGRGTLDMKGIGICELVAFMRVARSKRQPEHDLVFLAVADEEAGGKLGTAWLLEHRPDIFKGIEFALNEGGITETAADKVTYIGVEVGSKLACAGKLISKDRGALERARIELEPLQAPEDAVRILPEVAYFMKRIAPHRIQNREFLLDVNKTVAEGDFWRLHQSFRALAQNDVWVEHIEAVGDHYEAAIHLANLFDQEPDPWRDELQRRLPEGVELKLTSVERPVPLTPWDTSFCRLIQAAMKRTYGADSDVGPQLLQYSTNDSRFLRRVNIRAYGLWPFPVTLFQTEGIHSNNEGVRIDWFVEGVRATNMLIDSYCAGKSDTTLTKFVTSR
ncbi:MAG TPA: M20/M25/M40 family metallo-hydrolase [Thermoanaerobaculia bacterium]|nr:M20/M25/M40 family metallo-hydrolase [Thermoanaerobaculia bacterium]